VSAPPESLAGRRLSRREVEILGLASRGMGDAEIAVELFLSYNTVRTHMTRLRRKLAARDRAHAVALGFERGVLPSPALTLLAQARLVLLTVPLCPVHRVCPAPAGECLPCASWHRSRRVEAEAGLLLGTLKPGAVPGLSETMEGSNS
jgi:DNA-binding CsgD family transcriptional regulator